MGCLTPRHTGRQDITTVPSAISLYFLRGSSRCLIFVKDCSQVPKCSDTYNVKNFFIKRAKKASRCLLHQVTRGPADTSSLLHLSTSAHSRSGYVLTPGLTFTKHFSWVIHGCTEVLAEIIHRSSFYSYSLHLFMPYICADKLNTWFLIYQEFLENLTALRVPPNFITSTNSRFSFQSHIFPKTM